MSYTGFQRFSPDLLRIANGILKIDYVKKANRDTMGTPIIGVELRTKYHDDIPTPIKNLLINSNSLHNQTLANANVQVDCDKTLLYKFFLQDLLSIPTPIDTNNNINNFIENNLNICDSKGLVVQSISDSSDLSVDVATKTRFVTVRDLASHNPVTIINIVDGSSGVLHSLAQDGVHYGDFVAPPQNVRVRIE